MRLNLWNLKYLPNVVQMLCCVALMFCWTTFTQAQKPGSLAMAKSNDLAKAEAQKGNWSRWRGPNGDGISQETGLLKEWPADGPPLLWKSKGMGNGFSSIAVADGFLYTMGAKEGESHLVCAKADDGSVVWSTPLGDKGSGPNCTPTLDGDMVYGVTHDGVIACCNTKTGELVWKTSFSKDFGGKMHSGWGYSESPLIDGELLICTPGSPTAMLAGLKKKTGEVVWKTKMPETTGRKGGDGAGYSSIVIGNCGGVKQYITLVGRGVIGVEAKTGTFLWGYNQVANGTANIPTPIIKGDFVFCSSGYGDGGTALLKINRQGNQFAAEEVYWKSNKELQNHHGGMISLGDYVFMGHGHNNGFPVCVDMKTGTPTWGPDRGPGKESAAIAYADGHLYFRYQDGIMALIEANPKEYKLKGQFKIAVKNGNSWPHPVIAGGKLYLRDQNDLVCYDIHEKTK
jgi:outer membrane protein assembly factor BamB